VWGVGATGFMDSGVIDELGGPAQIVEAVREYDHARDHSRYYCFQKLNVLVDGLHVHPLLSLGRIADAMECVEKCTRIWDAHFLSATAKDARGFHAHELWLCCQSLLPVLVRLQLRQARKLAGALRLLKWNSSTCRILWDQAVRNWANALGGESNSFAVLQTFLNLQAYVIEPSVATTESVRAVLQARDTLLRISDISWDHFVLEWAMLETAALAAERLGDDELATFYVDKGLQRYACVKRSAQVSLLALKARIYDRAQEPDLALSTRREAASLASDARQPAQVVSVAFQCPDEKDNALVLRSCEVTGRSSEIVVQEFLAAGTMRPVPPRHSPVEETSNLSVRPERA